MSGRYVSLDRAWQASASADAPQPTRYLTQMLADSIHYGLPAAHGGAVRKFVARHGVPVGPVAWGVRHLRRAPRPELDLLIDRVRSEWSRLAGSSDRLPAAAPLLSALELVRADGKVTMLFADRPQPLVVVKAGASAYEREAEVLELAAPADVGPRYLGRLSDDAFVQEGLEGAPLRMPALRPDAAGRACASEGLRAGYAALSRLAMHSRREGHPEELEALVSPGLEQLDGAARRNAEAAWRDVAAAREWVLWHDDVSPQNCLIAADGTARLVDWATAKLHGPPGFDVLNLTRAFFDCSLAQTAWPEDDLSQLYEASWGSPLWQEGRAAAVAAGADESRLDALEVVFFLANAGSRLRRPDLHGTSAELEARLAALRAAA